MANDKLKHEDEPPGSTSPLQWIQESQIPLKGIEVANFMGTLDNNNAAGADDITMQCTTRPFSLSPFGDRTDPYAMDLPLTDIDLMTNLTPLSNSQDPMFDYYSVFGEGLTPDLPSPVSNFLAFQGNNTEFSQYHTPDCLVPPDNMVNATSDVNILQKPYVDRNLVTSKGDSAAALNSIQQSEEENSNTGRPKFFRNFISDGVSTPVLGNNIDDVEMSIKNNFMISKVQEDCPEKVDAGFLTLGIGRKTEDLSASNRSGIYVANNFERVSIPQPNTFHGRKQDTSSLNPSPDVAAGLPCLQNNAGGINMTTNNMPQDDDQHHFLTPGNRNVSLGFEGNWDTRSAYIDPNNSFQCKPDVSLIPVSSSLARLPDYGWSREYGLPLLTSSSTSTYLPLSETARNLFSDSSMVPIGVRRSTSLHNQLGKPFTANEGIAAQVAERGDVPGEFTFSQLPSNYYQPQVTGAVQSSTNFSRPVMTGEDFPVTKLNKTAQGFVGASLKRVAEETPETTSRIQCIKRRAQSSVGPSVPTLSLNVSSLPNLSKASSFTGPAPTAPSLPQSKASSFTVPAPTAPSLPHQVKSTKSLPHQVKSTKSFPPLPQTSLSLPSLSPTSLSLPSLSHTSLSLPIEAKGSTSLPPLAQNAPSLPPQAKSTPLVTPLSQTTLSLETLGRRTAVLPPLSQIAPSLPSQAKTTTSHQPLPQTAPYLRPKPESTTLLPALSQNASSLLSQARTTTSHPPLPQTAPNLRPKAESTTLLPALSQSASSLPPLHRIAPTLLSQVKSTTSHPPLPQTPYLTPKAKSTTALPFLSQNATSPLPLPQIAPPLSSQQWTAPPLPFQPWTASPLPSQQWTAPPRPQISRTAPPLPLKHRTAPPLPLKSQAASSIPISPQIAPPLPPRPQTASSLHIKWKGLGQPEPLGQKCLICKRDLSFTPEGPVFMPTIQPVAAVLPCGHTFHDHCLRLITPEDQVKNPPCIPCAIGES